MIKSEASEYDRVLRHRHDTNNSNDGSYNSNPHYTEERLRRTALTSMRETLLQKKSRITSESEYSRGLDRYELDRYNRDLDDKYNDYPTSSSSKRPRSERYRDEEDYYNKRSSDRYRDRDRERNSNYYYDRDDDRYDDYYDFPRDRDRERARHSYDDRREEAYYGRSNRDRIKREEDSDSDFEMRELRRLKEEDRQAKRLRELERERDELERKLHREKAKKRRREESDRRRLSRSRSRSPRARSGRRDRNFGHSRSRSRSPPRRGRRRRERNRRSGLRNRLAAEWNTGSLDTKVYIGNLGDDPPTKSELEEEFSEFGTVIRSWLARDPPGFGRVEFKYPEDAKKAIRTLHGKMYNGRSLIVERQRELRVRRKRRGRRGRDRDRSRSRSRSRSNKKRRRRERRKEERERRDRKRNKNSRSSDSRSGSGSRSESGSDSFSEDSSYSRERKRWKRSGRSRRSSDSSASDSQNSDRMYCSDVELPESPKDVTIPKQEPVELGCARPPTDLNDSNALSIENESDTNQITEAIFDNPPKTENQTEDDEMNDITTTQNTDETDTNDNETSNQNHENQENQESDNDSYETDSFAKSDSQSEHEHLAAYNIQQQRILNSNNNSRTSVIDSNGNSNEQRPEQQVQNEIESSEFVPDETQELSYGYGY